MRAQSDRSLSVYGMPNSIETPQWVQRMRKRNYIRARGDVGIRQRVQREVGQCTGSCRLNSRRHTSKAHRITRERERERSSPPRPRSSSGCFPRLFPEGQSTRNTNPPAQREERLNGMGRIYLRHESTEKHAHLRKEGPLSQWQVDFPSERTRLAGADLRTRTTSAPR